MPLNLIIFGVAIAAFLLFKTLSLVRPAVARDCLKKGAKVIDVRGQEEFRQDHLPGAINIPLDQLRSQIGQYAPRKEEPILLHCLSGGRSGIGKAMLKGMGYRKCFNLGSLARARKLLEGSASDPSKS